MAHPPLPLRPLVQLHLQRRGPLVEHFLVVGVHDDHLELGVQAGLSPSYLFQRYSPSNTSRLDGDDFLRTEEILPEAG